ncbi:MAG: class I SAM-dependent methyltransferase [Planctomycetota bacterium]
MDSQPNPAERWQQRYEPGGAFPTTPSALICACEEWLPSSGRALDIAGGAGRHAIWLATRGLQVTLCDGASKALDRTREAASQASVSITTLLVDLINEPLPRGPWDVILSYHFLHRPLFSQWQAALAPEGLLVFVQPTARNLERHDRPGRRFLLQEGELPKLLEAADLAVVEYEEGWLREGRHEAFAIAKPR